MAAIRISPFFFAFTSRLLTYHQTQGPQIIKKAVITLALLAVVALIGYPKIAPLLGTQSQESSSQAKSAPLKVDLFLVIDQSIEDKIFTTGTIRSNEEIELRSEVSGKLTAISLKEGEPVAQGQLLVKINDSELQAERNRTQTELQLALTREERQRKLLEKGGISQDQYDQTRNALNVLEAEVDLIEARIAKTEIRAPFDGVVGLKYVSRGSYISPSSQIASLQDIDPVKIDFSVPERYYSRVDPGDPIYFTVSGEDSTFVGTIYAIEPKVDTQTRTLQIRARSSNTNQMLIPGAFADIELVLEQIDDALLIPTIALIPEIDGQKVYRLKNGTVEAVRVETGIRTDKYIQITEGLAAGDSVLTTGLLQVRPGASVTVRNVEREVQMTLQ